MTKKTFTREEFAEKVAAALREEGVTEAYTYEALDNALTCPDRPTLRLEELYLESEGQPAHLVEQVARACAHVHLHPPEQPATWEEARKVVFPYVQPRSFHALRGFRAQQGEAVEPAPLGQVTEHVTVCVGTPTKWKVLVATLPDLTRWGVSFEAALEQARENIAARGLPDWMRSNDYPGVYRSPWKDEYGIARLMFPDVFKRLPLRGDPVIIAPTWQTLLVAGADDEQGLANLGRIGMKFLETDGCLIYRPLRVRGDALEHWLPPQGHAGHSPLRLLHLINECRDYAEQGKIGKRLFDRREEASNIPVPQVIALNGGLEYASLVTWKEGPPCALPKTDFVAFKRKAEHLGVAKWADLAKVVGKELEPLDIYPKRWLGRRFPADWQLSSMEVVPWAPGPGQG